MLKNLSIKNYALLADIEIDFESGLTILTGETGAGKSIILSALGTIIGDRVDNSVVRQGAAKAIIEGKFDIANNLLFKEYLEKEELASDFDEVILRREIEANSRSRAFMNDSPVQLTKLKRAGELLVDLHGQHDHQSLLKLQNHLIFLDEYGDLENDVSKVSSSYQTLQNSLKEFNQLEQKQKKASERKDFNQFQIADIDKVDPQSEEEQELLKEEKILQHSEKLFMLLNESYRALYENKDSIYEQLSRVKNALEEIETIDSYFENYKNDCESARLIAEDLAKGLQSYKSKIEFNPNRLEEIQARLSSITALKKKLGRSIDEILEFKAEMKRELDNIENLDEKIEGKREQVELEKSVYSKLCLELSEKRKGVARNVEKTVPEILAYLGMPRSRFKVALTYQDDPEGLISHQGKKYQGTAIGMDIAEFFMSTNEGEDVRPLAKVASGGEISRIMLALKSLLAKQGQIPVLIFDEIDIGVSGRIAQAVGRKLSELSKFHQVICITHLPQIASMAEHHYFVDKIETGGRTETKIRKLSANEKAEAIAKLLAGEEVSEAHLKSAQELLENAN